MKRTMMMLGLMMAACGGATTGSTSEQEAAVVYDRSDPRCLVPYFYSDTCAVTDGDGGRALRCDRADGSVWAFYNDGHALHYWPQWGNRGAVKEVWCAIDDLSEGWKITTNPTDDLGR